MSCSALLNILSAVLRAIIPSQKVGSKAAIPNIVNPNAKGIIAKPIRAKPIAIAGIAPAIGANTASVSAKWRRGKLRRNSAAATMIAPHNSGKPANISILPAQNSPNANAEMARPSTATFARSIHGLTPLASAHNPIATTMAPTNNGMPAVAKILPAGWSRIANTDSPIASSIMRPRPILLKSLMPLANICSPKPRSRTAPPTKKAPIVISGANSISAIENAHKLTSAKSALCQPTSFHSRNPLPSNSSPNPNRAIAPPTKRVPVVNSGASCMSPSPKAHRETRASTIAPGISSPINCLIPLPSNHRAIPMPINENII